MPLKKELFEFVKLTEPELITADLKEISFKLNSAIQDVDEEFELHHKKFKEIAKAKQFSKELTSDLKIINTAMLKNIFKEEIKTEKVKAPIKQIELKPYMPELEKFKPQISPEDAIRNLKRNLYELKKELGVE